MRTMQIPVSVQPRLLVTLLVATTLYITLDPLLEAGPVGEEKELTQIKVGSNAIDFELFKLTFGKSYETATEAVARQSLFLARALRSFISRIKFNQLQDGSFMTINKFSDLTTGEFEDLINGVRSRIGTGEAPLSPSSSLSSLSQWSSSWSSSSHKALLSKIKAKLRNLLHANMQPSADLLQPSNETLFHDHRGCLLPAKDQGRCSSCYIFTTLALYEWMHCRATGKLIAFSEQYVLDCGHRMGLKGCRNGKEGEVSLFVAKYGLELAQKYPYIARRAQCPYDDSTSPKLMASMRLRRPGIRAVYEEHFSSLLDDGPILVALSLSDKFQEYGGGVDDGMGCRHHPAGHGMLLVGDGHQNGKHFWLLRNSLGPSWGEKGYYKLAKDSNCSFLDNGLGYVPNFYGHDTTTRLTGDLFFLNPAVSSGAAALPTARQALLRGLF